MFIALIYLLVHTTPVRLSPPSCTEICKASADGDLNFSKCDCSLERSETSQRHVDLDDTGIYFEPADVYTLHRLSFLQPPFIILNPGLKINVERKAPKVILKRKSEKHSSNVSKRKATKQKRRNLVNESITFKVNTQPLYLDIDISDSDVNSGERTSNGDKGSRIEVSEKMFKDCVDIHLLIHSKRNNNSLIDDSETKQLDKNNLTDFQLMHEITKKCNQPYNLVKKSIEEIKSKWLRSKDASLKSNATKNVDQTTSKFYETSSTEQTYRRNLTDHLNTDKLSDMIPKSENISITENSLRANVDNEFDNTTEDNLSQAHESQTDESIFTTVRSSNSTQQSQFKKVAVQHHESHEEKKEHHGTQHLNTPFQDQLIRSQKSDLKDQEISPKTISLLTTTKSLEYEDSPSTEYPFKEIDQSYLIENSFTNASALNTRRFQVQKDTLIHKNLTNNSGILGSSDNAISSDFSTRNNENELQTSDYIFSTLEQPVIPTESSFTTSKYSQKDNLSDLSYRSYNVHSNITQEKTSVTESSFQTIRNKLIKEYDQPKNSYFNTQNDFETYTTDEFNGTDSAKSMSSSDMWTYNNDENDELGHVTTTKVNTKDLSMQSSTENTANDTTSPQSAFIDYSEINDTQSNPNDNFTADTLQTTYSSKYDYEAPVTNRDGESIYYNTTRLEVESTTTNIFSKDSSDATSGIEQSSEIPPKWFLITVADEDLIPHMSKVNYYIPGKMNVKNKGKVPTDNNNQRFPSTLSQLTTNFQDDSIKNTMKIIKRHGTFIDKNDTIPKVLTREFENDTVLSEVNEGREMFTDDDFPDDDVTSSSPALMAAVTKTTTLNTNAQHFKTSKSGNIDENTLTGKLYFLTGKSYIPARFVQKDDGELSVGMDLVTLCSKLNSQDSRSKLIEMICKTLDE